MLCNQFTGMFLRGFNRDVRGSIYIYITNYNYLALSENGVCPQVSILYWEKNKWILYWYPIFKQAQVKATH